MSDSVHDKRVIYRNEEGGVSIIIPTSECLNIDRLISTVPTGKPYQVLNVSEIPADRTYRNAWTYEEA